MFIGKKRGRLFTIAVIILFLIALISVFVSGPGITGQVVKNTCFEGTGYGECSVVKPKYCDDGALKFNCEKCGCPEDEVCVESGECIPKCSDGTLFGRCSKTQPFYCSKGNLVVNCNKCGCYEGGTCQANGECSGVRIISCDDGTFYDRCSANKPKYCDNGRLIDKCSLCGCDEGMECKDEKCVEKKDVNVEDPGFVVIEEHATISEAKEEVVKEKKDLKWLLSELCGLLKLEC
jgi:hypothetical protein